MNKNESYMSPSLGLIMASGEQSQRIKSYLKAFEELSRKDPDGFENLAPELLRRSVWNWRGADPHLSAKLTNWLVEDYKWSPFEEILPNDNHVSKKTKTESLDYSKLRDDHSNLLMNLEDRFSENHHRWDAATRDQFIVLGMIAMAGKAGERQGRLIHHLGMGLNSESTVQGSNAIRAAKIALTRLARPMSIFAPAKGHGARRLHSFENENLADLISRFVLNHDASILLPPPNMIV